MGAANLIASPVSGVGEPPGPGGKSALPGGKPSGRSSDCPQRPVAQEAQIMASSFTTPLSASRGRRVLPVALGAAALAVGVLGTGVAAAGGPSHTLRFTSTGIEDKIVNGVDIQTDRVTQNGKTT